MRKKLLPLDQEGDVARLFLSHVRGSQVDIGLWGWHWRYWRYYARVPGDVGEGDGCDALLAFGGPHVGHDACQDSVHPVLDESIGHEFRVRHGLIRRTQQAEIDGDRLLLLLARLEDVQDLAHHGMVKLVLESARHLQHAVSGCLRSQLHISYNLNGAFPHKVHEVVWVLGQAVEGKRRVVLQVGLVRVQKAQQRLQATHRHDTRLIVLVLCKSPERKRRHFPQLGVRTRQHHNQRRHRPPLHNLALVIRLHRRKLPQEQRRLSLRVGARRGKQINHGLQRALVEHPYLDMLRRVDQVSDHAHRLVVYGAVFGPQHMHQERQSLQVDDEVLVFLVFERKRPQRPRHGPLHLRLDRFQEVHQRHNTVLLADHILHPVVLVRQVGDRIRRPPAGLRSRAGQLLPLVPTVPPYDSHERGQRIRIADYLLMLHLYCHQPHYKGNVPLQLLRPCHRPPLRRRRVDHRQHLDHLLHHPGLGHDVQQVLNLAQLQHHLDTLPHQPHVHLYILLRILPVPLQDGIQRLHDLPTLRKRTRRPGHRDRAWGRRRRRQVSRRRPLRRIQRPVHTRHHPRQLRRMLRAPTPVLPVLPVRTIDTLPPVLDIHVIWPLQPRRPISPVAHRLGIHT
mmetsp:Transcript_16039/g.45929  ORF Transcript_16039/g.45929 Transcript_16039/m.45929 type:complete len:621 (+) Transcript_16039:560-2422(+)